MNKLEQELSRLIRLAFKMYESATGYWLFHAPEHFLQNFLFIHLCKKKYEVYAEATRKKTFEGMGALPVGRPPKSRFRRFNLLVWRKSSAEVRAVIEIKRRMSVDATVRRDAERVGKALSGRSGASAGYLILYSEAKGSNRQRTLEMRFKEGSESLNFRLLDWGILCSDDGDGWAAGYALMRASP